MTSHPTPDNDTPSTALDRRQLLCQAAGGLGGIALASMLGADGALADEGKTAGAKPRHGVLHHPPKAKRVVQLFMGGAASHVDMFDYKPLLIRENGKPWDPGEKVELFQNGQGKTMASP